MKKFMYFIDVNDYTWLINIDEIICVEPHNSSGCKSIIHILNAPGIKVSNTLKLLTIKEHAI